MKKVRRFQGVLVSVFLFTSFVFSQGGPPRIRLQPFLTGLTAPVLITSSKDDTRRLFVVQQGGIIKVVQPGSNTTTDFMNITTRVLSGGERGLLGLAFHPQFETNGYFFVNYTRQPDGATVVARYKTTDATNTVGDPNSERILLTIPQPFSNHNGGMIEFRTDGGIHNLYIGMGDGGSGNDPGNRAQNINELLGKFLRITPDVSGNNTNPPYTNPPDNPYVGIAGADEIYAIGVRNPWRWSFDRGGVIHQLWAGDVGQGAIEEVDIITNGGNFGWRVYEGTQCTGLDPGLCNPANFIPPVFEYSSASPSTRCSVTGGYVYRGRRRALPNGSYIYGDYCTGEIMLWNGGQQTLLLDTSRNITSFGEDDDGEIYVVGQGGTVEKVVRGKASADFDGDFRTDFSVFRPSDGFWYLNLSLNGTHRFQRFGVTEDIPTPEDFDGDSITDVAVFRPSVGTWYFLRSSDGTFGGAQWGASGDLPAAADYDGDAKSEFTVFRPSTGSWYTYYSTPGTPPTGASFGANGDIPTVGDYDGDDKADIGLFRPSTGTWRWLPTSMPSREFSMVWGASGYVPLPGDYNGDNRTDLAVWRPFNGTWSIRGSSLEDGWLRFETWGGAGDVPAVGDYDGDGQDDIAVFRPSDGVWYVVKSSNSAVQYGYWGASGDLPLPAFDRP